MTNNPLILQNITFCYQSQTRPVVKNLSLTFNPGWTGLVGANGSGKTTLLKLAAGELRPDQGAIQRPGQALYCLQTDESPPRGLARLLNALDGRSIRLRNRLGLTRDWLERWPCLSHGERKRAQLATALTREPPVLALDEPVNHLDRAGVEMITAALAGYQGIGLIVSHETSILDRLCGQCLFLQPDRVSLIQGNFSRARLQLDREEADLERRRQALKTKQAGLRRELSRRRQRAEKSARSGSKSKLARADSDSRDRINQAKNTGRDGVAGKLAGRQAKRLERADKAVKKAGFAKEYTTGLVLPGRPARRPVLVHLSGSSLELGPEALLACPALVFKSQDRIGLTGPNGSGKTSLLRRVIKSLTAGPYPARGLVYLPQETGQADSARLLERLQTLDRQRLGAALTIIRRLGSDPIRILESQALSPGEARKLTLALGLDETTELLIMDEPTNHLDPVSVNCLAQALASFPGALLLVSHDKDFLAGLIQSRWRIRGGARPGGGREYQLIIE